MRITKNPRKLAYSACIAIATLAALLCVSIFNLNGNAQRTSGGEQQKELKARLAALEAKAAASGATG